MGDSKQTEETVKHKRNESADTDSEINTNNNKSASKPAGTAESEVTIYGIATSLVERNSKPQNDQEEQVLLSDLTDYGSSDDSLNLINFVRFSAVTGGATDSTR